MSGLGLDMPLSDEIIARKQAQRWSPEDIQRVLSSHQRCNLCPLAQDPDTGYICVRGRGAPEPDILVVGEAPGYDESRTGESFIGRAAQHGIGIIKSLGIDINTVRFTNTTRCFPHDPPENGSLQPTPRTPDFAKETGPCVSYLFDEIQALKPRVIISLGGYATRVLLGVGVGNITKVAGNIFYLDIRGDRYPIIPCPHFSADLRNPGRYTESIAGSFQLAQSMLSDAEPPVTTHVLNSNHEAIGFLKGVIQKYKDGEIKYLAYDLEYDVLVGQDATRTEANRMSTLDAFNPEKKLVAASFAYSKDVGYSIPLYGKDSLVDPELIAPYLREVVTTIPLIAHNWLKAEGAWTWLKLGVKPTLFFDTMLASFCLWMKTVSHGLKGRAMSILGWPDWSRKIDVEIRSLPLEERSYKNIPVAVLGKYSAIDPAATWGIFEYMQPLIEQEGLGFALEILHQASQDFLDIENRGAYIDEDLYAKITESYPLRSQEILAKIRSFPEIQAFEAKHSGKKAFVYNPKSPIQVGEVIYGYFGAPFIDKRNPRDVKQVTIRTKVPAGTTVLPLQGAQMWVDQVIWLSSRATPEQRALGMETVGERNTIINATPTTVTLDTPTLYDHETPLLDTGGRSMDDAAVVALIYDTYCQCKISPSKNKCMLCDGSGRKLGEVKRRLHDFLNLHRDFKKVDKIIDSYIVPLKDYIVPGTRRIVFNYILHATDTGRLATTSFGMQTVPARSDIRRLFVSEWQSMGGLIVSMDQSQLELRVLASESMDPKFVETYLRCPTCQELGRVEDYGLCRNCGSALGEDMHGVSASELYDCARSEVTPDMRRNAKAINFGIIYGMGPKRLSEDTGMSRSDAEARIKRFFDRFDGVSDWINARHKEYRLYGYVRSKLGRKLYVEGWQSGDKTLEQRGERESQNYPIQSLASDLTLIGMSIAKDTLKQGHRSVPWEFTHDSVEFDVYPGELLDVLQIGKRAMEKDIFQRVPPLQVPLLVESEVGVRWDGTLKVKKVEGDTLIVKGKRKFYEELVPYLQKVYAVKTEIIKEYEDAQDAELLKRKSYTGDDGGVAAVEAMIRLN